MCQLLEQQNGGSAVQNVADIYKEALPSDLADRLRALVATIDGPVLTSVLHDLMVNQLGQSTYSSQASLKEYLEYTTETVLDELDWFRQLPDELCLAHTHAVYNFFV